MTRLFVLGAGFSKPAGFPLGNELFAEVVSQSQMSVAYENILKPDISDYLLFHEKTIGEKIEEDEIHLEKFMAFLDINHYFWLEGSDTWTDTGNRSQHVIRNLIGKVLFLCSQNLSNELLAPYKKFSRSLKPKDIVITFNYDTLLETVLEQESVPYRRFPTRFESFNGFAGTPIDTDEVIIYKLHGSIDWFDITSFNSYLKEMDKQGFPPQKNNNVVFGFPEKYGTKPLIEGTYPPDSDLNNIYQISDLRSYYQENPWPLYSPVILAPSRYKVLYSKVLLDLWEGWGKAGIFESIAIIGYSMPSHDEYIRQLLYRITRIHETFDPKEFMIAKTNVRIIDKQNNRNSISDFKERYRFLDWSKVDATFDGFNEEAIDLINSN